MFEFTQAPVTVEAKALAELLQIDSMSERALDMFIQQSSRPHRLFWHEWVPPEVKIKQAGTNALHMFQVSGAVQAFIKSLRPDYEELGIPEEYDFPVFKADGSGTLTRKNPAPESTPENPE